MNIIKILIVLCCIVLCCIIVYGDGSYAHAHTVHTHQNPIVLNYSQTSMHVISLISLILIFWIVI